MTCAGWTLAFPPMPFRESEGIRYLLVLVPPELSLVANVHLTLNQRLWNRRRDLLEAALLSGIAAGATLVLFVLPLLWLWRY